MSCFTIHKRNLNFGVNMNKRKLFWFEVGFFVFYFILLQFFTDLQYILEYDNENLASASIQRLTTTPFFALAYYFYYKRQLPLLFKKHHLRFLLSVVAYFFQLDIITEKSNFHQERYYPFISFVNNIPHQVCQLCDGGCCFGRSVKRKAVNII